jgi:hypothetical protein
MNRLYKVCITVLVGCYGTACFALPRRHVLGNVDANASRGLTGAAQFAARCWCAVGEQFGQDVAEGGILAAFKNIVPWNMNILVSNVIKKEMRRQNELGNHELNRSI